MIVGLYGVSLCLLMPSLLSIGGIGELDDLIKSMLYNINACFFVQFSIKTWSHKLYNCHAANCIKISFSRANKELKVLLSSGYEIRMTCIIYNI